MPHTAAVAAAAAASTSSPGPSSPTHTPTTSPRSRAFPGSRIVSTGSTYRTHSHPTPPPSAKSPLPFVISREAGELSSFPRYEDMSTFAHHQSQAAAAHHHHDPTLSGSAPSSPARGQGFLQSLIGHVGSPSTGHGFGERSKTMESTATQATAGSSASNGVAAGLFGMLRGAGLSTGSPTHARFRRSSEPPEGPEPTERDPLLPATTATATSTSAPRPPGRPPGPARDPSTQLPIDLSAHRSPRRLSSWSLMALTVSMAGAQATWTVELGSGTPFLLSLGLSPALTSLVWLAGPLSGTLVAPLIGALSDAGPPTRFKRRKYIIFATGTIILSTLLLAFCQPLGALLASLFDAGDGDWDPNNGRSASAHAVALAVIAFYFLDFALNALQSACRALILDRAPGSQQSVANAWQGRMTNAGSVVGYAFGVAELGKWSGLKWLGGGQFRKLCIVSLVILSVCVGTTCVTQEEGRPRGRSSSFKAAGFLDDEDDDDAEATPSPPTNAPNYDRQLDRVGSIGRPSLSDPPQRAWTDPTGIGAALKGIYATARSLPSPIRRVCYTQIGAWMAWMPILFYASTYVAEIYLKTSSHHRSSSSLSSFATGLFVELAKGGKDKDESGGEADDRQADRDAATRAGSQALLIFSLVAMVSAALLPWLTTVGRTAFIRSRGTGKGWRWVRKTLGWVTPRNFWTASLVFIFVLMVCTFWTTTARGATALVAFFGIPWAVACWVPYALIMEYVREIEDASNSCGPLPPPTVAAEPEVANGTGADSPTSSSERRKAEAAGINGAAGPGEVAAHRALQDCEPLVRRPGTLENGGGTGTGSGKERGGTVLGIHNLSIVLPQFVVAIIASIIFKITDTTTPSDQPPLSPDPDADGSISASGVVWVLRFGGLMALVAAVVSRILVPPPSEIDYLEELDEQIYRDDDPDVAGAGEGEGLLDQEE